MNPSKYSVLVIEDEHEMRDTLMTILSEEGYQTVGCTDGNEAIKLVNLNAFDLAITDIILPNKEGLETIIEFKKLVPKMKIMAISGGGVGKANDYLTMAEKIGVDGTLEKPFHIAEFLKLVEDILGRND